MSSLFELKKEITANPHVSFHFEGVIALGISDNYNRFDAGIIKDLNNEAEIPNHIRSISVVKIVHANRTILFSVPGATGNVFVLDFLDPAGGRNRLFRGKANPSDMINDFDWVIDVENHMHGRNRVPIVGQALRTILRARNLSAALFYADEVVAEPVATEQEDGRNRTDIPASAESVKVLIPLKQTIFLRQKISAQQSIEKCELKYEPSVRYEIVFKNSCNPNDCENTNVAPFYNNLIGNPGGGTRRRIFRERGTSRQKAGPPLTPASQCAPINFGVSGELPDPAS